MPVTSNSALPLKVRPFEPADKSLRGAILEYMDLFPVEEEERLDLLVTQLWENGEQGIYDRKNMLGHVTTSMLVLSPCTTKVLVIHHRATGKLLAPGGHVEMDCEPLKGDVDLRQQALRELAEETGITDVEPVFIGERADTPLDLDSHHIAPRPAKMEGPHYHHDFMYLAIARSETVPVAQASEVSFARWVPLDELLTADESTRNRRLKQKLCELGFLA